MDKRPVITLKKKKGQRYSGQNMAKSAPKKEKMDNDDEAVLARAQKQVGRWFNYFGSNIQQGRVDKQFLYFDQWTPKERNELRLRHKPVVQFNKLHDHVKKVIGEFRQNTPTATVLPVDPDIPQETMDACSHILNGIFYKSRTNIVDQTACENALSFGYGAMFLTTDYESQNSFNQEIVPIGFQSPEVVFFDPDAKEVDKNDGDFCGWLDFMSAEQIEKQWGVGSPRSFSVPFQWNSTYQFYLAGSRTIAIANYWEKQYYSKKIYLLESGETVDAKEYDALRKKHDALHEDDRALLEEDIGERFPEIENERVIDDAYEIKGYKLLGDKVLEETVWPSRYLPGVFVDGYSYYIDGKQYTQSFIHQAKDAQRFLNYCGVEVLQAIKNTRRETYLTTTEMTAGNEYVWRNPDMQQGALHYRPHVLATGQVLTPTPITSPPINPAFLEQYQRAEHDIGSILGRTESVTGAQGNEKSNLIMAARLTQGNLGSFIWFDNTQRAIESIARNALDLLPAVYDAERTVVAQGPNKEPVVMHLNQQMPDGSIMNDLTKLRDKAKVQVSLGASFEMQRQQHLNFLIELMSAAPQAAPLLADLVAENIQVENMPQIVKRLKNLVPPQILAEENGEPPPPPPEPPLAEKLAQQQLLLNEKELKLKEQSQQLEAAKLMQQGQKDKNDMINTQMRTHAEIQKSADSMRIAGLDHKAKVMSVLEKIAVSRHKIMNAHSERG